MQLLAHIRRKTAPVDTALPPALDDTITPPPLARVQTEQERRADALDAITADPNLRQFYERVIPPQIEPAAWVPFWPSAWRGLQAGSFDHDSR